MARLRPCPPEFCRNQVLSFSTWDLTYEFGVDGDFSFEKFGDGAAGFGGFDGGVEFGLIGSGNGGDEMEMALGDGEAVADFVEGDGGGGFELLRGDACATE